MHCACVRSLTSAAQSVVDEKVKHYGSGGEVGFAMKLDVDVLKCDAESTRQDHLQKGTCYRHMQSSA